MIVKKDVFRLDRGEPLTPAHQTEEGYLYFEGRATRAGVFRYQDSQGKAFYELRPPEEVSKPESLATLARKPVTDLHPNEFVDSTNAKKYAVGTLDGEVLWEHDFADGYVKVRGCIMRSDAVDSVIKKARTEFSCGYAADIEYTPGEWTDSAGVKHRYDAIQRNIRYNHLALVDAGRAGKEVKLRLDDAFQVDEPETAPQAPQPKQEVRKMKIRIDGREYTADEPAAQRAIDDVVEASKSARGKVDLLQAKLDAGDAEKTKLEAEVADLRIKAAELDVIKVDQKQQPTPEQIEAARLDWFNARVQLLENAKARNVEVADSADNDAIKRAIVLSRFDESDLPTQAHVDAAFALMSKEEVKPERKGDKVADAFVAGSVKADNAQESAIERAEREYMERVRNANKR